MQHSCKEDQNSTIFKGVSGNKFKMSTFILTGLFHHLSELVLKLLFLFNQFENKEPFDFSSPFCQIITCFYQTKWKLYCIYWNMWHYWELCCILKESLGCCSLCQRSKNYSLLKKTLIGKLPAFISILLSYHARSLAPDLQLENSFVPRVHSGLCESTFLFYALWAWDELQNAI